MKNWKSITLSGVGIVAVLAMSACTDSGVEVPLPGEGTGSANASQPQAEPEQPAEPGEVETPAPEGGAAARVGDTEITIDKVACTVIQGKWSMSGSDAEADDKVAVTGPEDRSAVETASVVLANGTVVQVMPGTGTASIAWEGETFTVTGTGALMNLNEPDATGEEEDFVITATCG